MRDLTKNELDKSLMFDIKKHFESDKNLIQISRDNKFKVGDTITFMAGYDNNIKYKSKIVALRYDLQHELEIYVLWDCYWSPIRDVEYRKIKIID